jgi:hypothetical protein
MGCFDITKEMSDHINAMIGRYWWSNSEKENKGVCGTTLSSSRSEKSTLLQIFLAKHAQF